MGLNLAALHNVHTIRALTPRLPCCSPTRAPTDANATRSPSRSPTTSPSGSPTGSPTTASPTASPSAAPSSAPTRLPSASPTCRTRSCDNCIVAGYDLLNCTAFGLDCYCTTRLPTSSPSAGPTVRPTGSPSTSPTRGPSASPTRSPTVLGALLAQHCTSYALAAAPLAAAGRGRAAPQGEAECGYLCFGGFGPNGTMVCRLLGPGPGGGNASRLLPGCQGHGVQRDCRMHFDGGACVACAIGRAKSGINHQPCAPCAPGLHAPAAAAEHCQACPSGRFSPTPGATARQAVQTAIRVLVCAARTLNAVWEPWVTLSLWQRHLGAGT